MVRKLLAVAVATFAITGCGASQTTTIIEQTVTTVTKTSTALVAAASTTAQPKPPASGGGSPGGGGSASSPGGGPCDGNPCIGDWQREAAEGGTVVQCSDGTWSHAGGLSGACSDHGGESSA